MRPLLITLAGACASLTASLTVWVALSLEERPYFEPLEGSLLRTTAGDSLVQTALERVVGYVRPAGRSLDACGYRERAEAWFSEPDYFGRSGERASRHERVLTDHAGRLLRIEVLKGEEMPSLVFVHHEDREVAGRVVSYLANELQGLGVERR